jgi:CRISPR system Cascade subunit CasA
MVPTFDLTEEPWIPVVRLDTGKLEEVGLREALCRAHEYRAVRDPLPTVEFGLYRLHAVLALDIFQLEDTDMLGALRDEGQFDAATVHAYFDKWQDRFDLLSKQYPFLQTAGMEREGAKPLAGLLPPIPSGTNAAHFHHGQEGEFGVSPAAAARLLTSIAPFMTAGGAGLAPSLNGAPPWYALIVGDTLFDTLCRNAYVLDRQKIALGEPSWRSKRVVMPGERCTGADLLEGWTWRPRRLQLVPGAAGRCSLTGQDSPVLVHSMKFAAGASCDFTKGGWRDPSVPYRIDEDGPKVMRPQESKAVWRDTAPLALLSSRSYTRGESKFQFERPHIIEQWVEMIQSQYAEDGPLNLTLYGMRTDLKMKVFEWYREPLALPRSLVLKDDFAMRVQKEMERADSIAYALKKAIQKTYKREGKGNAKAFDDLIAYTQRQYWSSLHGTWERLLGEIAPLSAAQDAEWTKSRAAWWEALGGAGRAALTQAIGDLDTDAEALKRQVEAEQSFQGALHSILVTEEEKAAREAAKKSRKTKGAAL